MHILYIRLSVYFCVEQKALNRRFIVDHILLHSIDRKFLRITGK